MEQINEIQTNFQNVSIKMIERATVEKRIRALALFHLLKFAFVNSVIFNYRPRMNELAKRFGISEKTLYTYIKQLREYGLIIDFPGNPDNLHLAGIRTIKDDLKDRKTAKINFSGNDNIETVVCRLRAKLIERHQAKMAFMKSVKRYERKQGNKRNLNKVVHGEGAYSPILSLSVRTTANILKVSEKTAQNTLKSLQQLEVIKLHPAKSKYICQGFIPPGYLEGYPGHKFIAEGGTFVHFGNRVECLEFPVKVPKITPKLYLKFYNSDNCKKYHNY